MEGTTPRVRGTVLNGGSPTGPEGACRVGNERRLGAGKGRCGDGPDALRSGARSTSPPAVCPTARASKPPRTPPLRNVPLGNLSGRNSGPKRNGAGPDRLTSAWIFRFRCSATAPPQAAPAPTCDPSPSGNRLGRDQRKNSGRSPRDGRGYCSGSRRSETLSLRRWGRGKNFQPLKWSLRTSTAPASRGNRKSRTALIQAYLVYTLLSTSAISYDMVTPEKSAWPSITYKTFSWLGGFLVWAI